MLKTDYESESRGVERPWRHAPLAAVYPVFLPFLGCPRHCIFCAQNLQTGVATPPDLAHIEKRLAACRQDLKLRAESGKAAPELAFYGGTFTALPEDVWRLCINFADIMRGLGLITGFRCSTRPDCLAEERLKNLASAGCNLVELGIQSFSDDALACSMRGYDGHTCKDACVSVASHGLGLGVQLMPGMPGSSAEAFLRDVRIALDGGANVLRFYPCLVLKGTALENLWRDGAYVPWSYEQTVEILAKGWLMAMRGGAHVIRMGLAPQSTLEGAVLAGPEHPALGSMVMSAAMLHAIQEMLEILRQNTDSGRGDLRLYIPRKSCGYFWGWKGTLRRSWSSLGFNSANIIYWDKDSIKIMA